MMDMSGIAKKPLVHKVGSYNLFIFMIREHSRRFWKLHVVFHCGKYQVPPMGLPGGWPGAPPFMPMPGETWKPRR